MKTSQKFLSVILVICFISIFNSGCKKDASESGLISVENTLTPASAKNGASIQWVIKITNSGSALVIDSIRGKHVCTSGWANGQTLINTKLTAAGISFAAKETKTVFNSPIAVTNTGTTDVDVKITVTAYYKGGSGVGTATYKITR